MTNHYGTHLRALRGKRSAAEVARAAGISKKYLWNIESGARLPRDDRKLLRILTDGLGLSSDEAKRSLVDIRLQGLGLTEPHLRSLCADYLTGALPPAVIEATSALFVGFQQLGHHGSKEGNDEEKAKPTPVSG